MTRLTMGDTWVDVAMKMSDGNPGALSVIVKFQKEDLPEEGIGYVMILDTLGIYGPDIWCLYKDVCDQNIHRMAVWLDDRR